MQIRAAVLLAAAVVAVLHSSSLVDASSGSPGRVQKSPSKTEITATTTGSKKGSKVNTSPGSTTGEQSITVEPSEKKREKKSKKGSSKVKVSLSSSTDSSTGDESITVVSGKKKREKKNKNTQQPPLPMTISTTGGSSGDVGGGGLDPGFRARYVVDRRPIKQMRGAVGVSYDRPAPRVNKRFPLVRFDEISAPVMHFTGITEGRAQMRIGDLYNALVEQQSTAYLVSPHAPLMTQTGTKHGGTDTLNDRNWGCGYRNLQSVLHVLMHLQKNNAITDMAGMKNLAEKLGSTPEFDKIQAIVRKAWDKGIEAEGFGNAWSAKADSVAYHETTLLKGETKRSPAFLERARVEAERLKALRHTPEAVGYNEFKARVFNEAGDRMADAEASVVLLRLGIPFKAFTFQDGQRPVSKEDVTLAASKGHDLYQNDGFEPNVDGGGLIGDTERVFRFVEWYFTQAARADLNTDVLPTDTPVIVLSRPPIWLMYGAHSLAIVGFERTKDGSTYLLINEPLVLSTPKREGEDNRKYLKFYRMDPFKAAHTFASPGGLAVTLIVVGDADTHFDFGDAPTGENLQPIFWGRNVDFF